MTTAKLLAIFTAAMLCIACGEPTCQGDIDPIMVPYERQLDQTAYADQTYLLGGVTFRTPGPWSSRISEPGRTEAPDWIHISPGYGAERGDYTLQIELEPNTTGKDRIATIEIRSGDNQITITVTQTNKPEYEPDEKMPKGRLTKITGYYNGTPEVFYTLEYDIQGRISALHVQDAQSCTFTYGGNDRLLYKESYLGEDYNFFYAWETKGFFNRNFNKITSAEYTDSERNIKSTLTYFYENNTDFIKRIEEPASTYADIFTHQYNSCSRIDWDIRTNGNIEYSSGSVQKFIYDTSNGDTNRKSSAEFRALFYHTPCFNPALIVINNSDLLRAFGFYGTQDQYMPVKVENHDGLKIDTEEYTYNYTIPANWVAGQTFDGMEITAKKSDNIGPYTIRAVFTFESL